MVGAIEGDRPRSGDRQSRIGANVTVDRGGACVGDARASKNSEVGGIAERDGGGRGGGVGHEDQGQADGQQGPERACARSQPACAPSSW